MSDPPNPHRSAPREGDVVIACASNSAVRYTVCQLPGVVQFSAQSREEAVRLARGFASAQGVDLWLSEGGLYELLQTFRPQVPGT